MYIIHLIQNMSSVELEQKVQYMVPHGFFSIRCNNYSHKSTRYVFYNANNYKSFQTRRCPLWIKKNWLHGVNFWRNRLWTLPVLRLPSIKWEHPPLCLHRDWKTQSEWVLSGPATAVHSFWIYLWVILMLRWQLCVMFINHTQ